MEQIIVAKRTKEKRAANDTRYPYGAVATVMSDLIWIKNRYDCSAT